jgi:hypothetical protein
MTIVKSVPCKAHTKRGPCRARAIIGGTVCVTHGGASPQVKRKAAERIADLIDPDRALRELAALAYADPGELFDESGNLRPIKDMPKGIRSMIGQIEIVKKNAEAGDGATDIVHKIKMWDKVPALGMLLKHLGLLIERQAVQGVVEIRWKDTEE